MPKKKLKPRKKVAKKLRAPGLAPGLAPGDNSLEAWTKVIVGIPHAAPVQPAEPDWHSPNHVVEDFDARPERVPEPWIYRFPNEHGVRRDVEVSVDRRLKNGGVYYKVQVLPEPNSVWDASAQLWRSMKLDPSCKRESLEAQVETEREVFAFLEAIRTGFYADEGSYRIVQPEYLGSATGWENVLVEIRADLGRERARDPGSPLDEVRAGGHVPDPDWTKSCGSFGGNLAEVPYTRIYRFPNNRGARRRVKFSMSTFRGFSAGAVHYYSKAEPENNSVWDDREKVWRQCWDDPKSRDYFFKAHLMDRREAVKFLDVVAATFYGDREKYALDTDYVDDGTWIEVSRDLLCGA